MHLLPFSTLIQCVSDVTSCLFFILVWRCMHCTTLYCVQSRGMDGRDLKLSRMVLGASTGALKDWRRIYYYIVPS